MDLIETAQINAEEWEDLNPWRLYLGHLANTNAADRKNVLRSLDLAMEALRMACHDIGELGCEVADYLEAAGKKMEEE
jgi:hypothetical protein